MRARLILAVGATFLAGWWVRMPCHVAGWPYRRELIFGQRCYSDLPFLYERLAGGAFPYSAEVAAGFEYPVVTGYAADLTARLSRLLGPADVLRTYVEVNGLLLLGCALVVVWATVATRGKERDGLLVALAPSLALAGLINWDLLAVAATSLALLAWARQRPALAGALIGLGTAVKLYPLLILFPIVLLAIRDRTAQKAMRALTAAALTWAAVNLPVLLVYPHGWTKFWTFNADRPAEFGSIWYALGLLDIDVGPVDRVAISAFLLGCAGIATLALRAKRRPDLNTLAFLTVAAFVVTNKVYSPQYVLWLLPLAVLAGVPTRAFLVWQATEVLYWLAIWHYLTVGETWHYPAATFARIGATLWLVVQCTWSLRQVEPSEENAAYPRATMSNAT